MTLDIDVKTKKWRTSSLVIHPSGLVKRESIGVNDHIHLTVQREDNVKDLFGVWKTRKRPLQLKHESREGWE